MNKTSHIKFDAATEFGLTAVAVIRVSLAESHGCAFADAFVVDHAGAIQRAARARLNGRMDAEVRRDIHELRRISQGPSSHD